MSAGWKYFLAPLIWGVSMSFALFSWWVECLSCPLTLGLAMWIALAGGRVTRGGAVESWNILVWLGFISALHPSPWEEYSQAHQLAPEESQWHLEWAVLAKLPQTQISRLPANPQTCELNECLVFYATKIGGCYAALFNWLIRWLNSVLSHTDQDYTTT